MYNISATNKKGSNQMNNIKKYRIKKGMKQIELCKILGITQGALSGWENGKYEPDIKSLNKLAEIFETSIDDIMGYARKQTPTRRIVRIPVLGDVAAGIPIEAITDIDDYEEIDLSEYEPGEYVSLRIKGNSMEPTMPEGTTVIVRIQNTIENGETAIVTIGNEEAICKKIKKTPKGVTLISTNPIYDPMFFTNKEIEELPVCIWGRVIEFRGKL